MEKLESEMESMRLQSSDDEHDQVEDFCRDNGSPFREKVDTAEDWRETINKVHDFGFFRYDPGAIQFLNYEEIPLVPEAACGLEIRVVGNDSNEKVSILAGTLARLDRNAPTYKKDGYNDFNTFYIQAASGTRGGSSGSPVIDRQGKAVALNAGGKNNRSSSSSAFFLPLERVVRTLKLIQKGKDSNKANGRQFLYRVVTFCYKGFDEVRRLGLQLETEQMVRQASLTGETGMLVVHSVVPGGPSHTQLEPGDVLVRVNGEVTTQFLILETLLDDSVGNEIELQIERGSTSLTINIMVQDLHSITPNHFLEVGGAVIHPLSYQQARNFRFHCGLVYISDPGGARVPLEYIYYRDRHRTKSVLVTIDRHEWYDIPKIYTRDDSSGLWIARPAIPLESLLLASCVGDLGQGLKEETSALSSEYTVVENTPQVNDLELSNSIASMEANYDQATKEVYSTDEYDVPINTQVLGDLSRSGNGVADSSSHESGEIKLEDPMIMESANSSLHEYTTKAATNGLFPECMIEPALVMLEVNVPPSCLLDGVHSQHFSELVSLYTILKEWDWLQLTRTRLQYLHQM
ncbi:hypothetical protein GH714_032735 [Hevea brasiliensis]|uniref:PDZ domain-containing protein n=1 Tax=Hevea brasiliensis TaxID=3981 RepID=A0A6A6L255_HEVBR|nr:hypothetical protein GH714_032735 [Hevea brasiliensis]